MNRRITMQIAHCDEQCSGGENPSALRVNRALKEFALREVKWLLDERIVVKPRYDLVREVRSREPERGGKIPAVSLIAYVRVEDRVRVLSAGFQLHIAKPIDLNDLIAAVVSLTRRNEMINRAVR